MLPFDGDLAPVFVDGDLIPNGDGGERVLFGVGHDGDVRRGRAASMPGKIIAVGPTPLTTAAGRWQDHSIDPFPPPSRTRTAPVKVFLSDDGLCGHDPISSSGPAEPPLGGNEDETARPSGLAVAVRQKAKVHHGQGKACAGGEKGEQAVHHEAGGQGRPNPLRSR